MRSVTASTDAYPSLRGVSTSNYTNVVINGSAYNNIFASFVQSVSYDSNDQPFYVSTINSLRVPLGLTITPGERYRIMFYFTERGMFSAMGGYSPIYFTLKNSSLLSLGSGSYRYSTLQTPDSSNNYLSRISYSGDLDSTIEFLSPFVGTFSEKDSTYENTVDLYIHPIIFDFYNTSDSDVFLNYVSLDLSLSASIEIPYYINDFNRTLAFGGLFDSLGQSFGSGSDSSSGGSSSGGGSSVDLTLTNSYLSSQLSKLDDIGVVLNNIFTLEQTLNTKLESILQAILSISGDSTQSSILDQVTELTDKVVDLDADAQEKLDSMDDKLQESKEKLESMQEQLSRLEGLSESQITDISSKVQVGSQQASSAVVENTLGTIFDDTNMILPMLILVFSTATVGYILFGKK